MENLIKNWKKPEFVFTALLGFFFLFRLFIITQLDLIDDEAYHWSWTMRPDWSYFDHPGMVAWIQWPFIHLLGNEPWVLRLPGVLIFAGCIYIIYVLAKQSFNISVARYVAILMFLIPLWSFASLGLMPDLPMTFFWLLLALLFWQSVRPDEKRWSLAKSWILIGLAMGFGMNSKLSCCLIGLGMGLYLLLTPSVRKHLLSPWPYVGVLITLLMMFPILYWNSENEWASFVFQFYRRHKESAGFSFSRWLQFWGYQWLFMSPPVYILLIWSLIRGFKKTASTAQRFISCLALPALVIFYQQPLFADFKPHWSGPAYLLLVIPSVSLFFELQSFAKKIYKWTALSFFGLIYLLYIPLLTPTIPYIHKWTQPQVEFQPRFDFTNEFYGWRELGQHLLRRQSELETDWKTEPLLASTRYEMVAQTTWAVDRASAILALQKPEPVWHLGVEINQYLFWQNRWEKQSGLKVLDEAHKNGFILVSNDKYNRPPSEVESLKGFQCHRETLPIYRNSLTGEKILARSFYLDICPPTP